MYYDGHKVRIVNGYPAIYRDECNYTEYIHILEMEKYLGRKLLNGEVVHHCDRNRSNFSIDNLWCFRSSADHAGYHNGLDVVQDNDGVYYCPNLYESKKCKDCGRYITYGANRCKECSLKNNFTIKHNASSLCELISRDELKKLIRQETFVDIGKRFNVTDNAIRKWCKKYDLPFNKNRINQYTDSEWANI